jgi:hypothetical protein
MQKNSKTALLAAASLIIVGIITMAFQDSTKHNLQVQTPISTQATDTVPDKHIKIDVDVDQIMKEVDKQLETVQKNLKEIEWEKISKNIEASIKDINLDKIRTEVTASLDKVDMDKIKREIESSLKDINTVKINEEVQKAMEEVKANLNSEEFKKNMKELKNINTAELNEELRKAKIEIEKNKVDLKLEMKKATEELKKAKVNLAEYKQMISEMRSDGLISKSENYDIQFKKQELYINGKKQPAEVTRKYRKYFKDDDDVEVRKNSK